MPLVSDPECNDVVPSNPPSLTQTPPFELVSLPRKVEVIAQYAKRQPKRHENEQQAE
jgi:hypothetical protein